MESALDHTLVDVAWPENVGPQEGAMALFFLAEVLEYVVEFPLNLLCNIILSVYHFFCQITYSLNGFVSKGYSQFLKSYVHVDQYSQIAMFSILGSTSRVIARTVALNNERKKKWRF